MFKTARRPAKVKLSYSIGNIIHIAECELHILAERVLSNDLWKEQSIEGAGMLVRLCPSRAGNTDWRVGREYLAIVFRKQRGKGLLTDPETQAACTRSDCAFGTQMMPDECKLPQFAMKANR